jgi:hypothetical protein
MVSRPDFALWILGTVASAFVCGLIVLRGRLRRYRVLACYFGLNALVEWMRLEVLRQYGLISSQYAYIYYYSDCLLTLLLYFAVAEQFVRVWDSITARKCARIGSFLLAVWVGIFSWVEVERSSAKMLTHLVVDYSDCLYFATVCLGLVLFVASLWNRGVSFQDRLLAFILASYLALMSWQYLMRNLYPGFHSIIYTNTLLWMVFLLGVAYIFSDPAVGKDERHIYL